MRPTRGMLVALVLAAVLHLLARVTGTAWLSLGAGAYLALPVAALLLRPRLDGLQVLCEPVQTRVGDRVEIVVTVRSTGPLSTPALRLVDRTPELSPVVVAVPALRPGGEVTAVLARTAVSRGWQPHTAIELSSTAPFGLLRVVRLVEVSGPFAVAPRRVPAVELVVGGDGSGRASRPLAGTGVEVLGLRAWRPGDGARAVSARASARHGRPVVLERERDAGSAVVLLCAGAGRGPGWEQAVERSCAIAEEVLRRGSPLVLVAAALPAPERPDRGAVLDWHARLDAAAPLDGGTLQRAVRAAGPGGALVLVGAEDRAVRQACADARIALTALGGR